ncbi:M67 family metallopeptidase [Ferrovibrio xuzhouensis]|uniref:M67 family metallopeptidase n=1 Tax=Ferrovibrio xuzhouensis TaxID=1576914 RepID=A0ABV7VEC7_9PROT
MLVLTPDQSAALAGLAEAAFPQEACALLVGIDHGNGRVEIQRIVATANVAAEPARGFEIDPATHIALLRSLREGNAPERIVGHWHSHPNGRPEPSATDAAMIHDPGLVWLISAVDAAGHARPPRAFRPLPDGRFDPMPVETAAASS